MEKTKTAERVGDWMMTASGTRFYPLDPRPNEIHISDIIHHLARVCRYGGAVRGHYSVAEHCCHLADFFTGPWPGHSVDKVSYARAALLHDAAEAYIGDLIRPIKPTLPAFAAIESPLEQMIWLRFCVPTVLPLAVKEADSAIIGDERPAVFTSRALEVADWAPRKRLGVEIFMWERDRAADEFARRFGQLFPEFRL
jgi:hypothetical protein